jgi:extradiol dioxygenase
MKINALGYIGFSSPNHETWRKFGPETLALGLADDGKDGSIRLRMDERHHRITIHPGQSDNLDYLGWELKGRIEFEAALKHLEQKGVRYQLATADELENRRVVGMASFLDPHKFRHEIYYGQQFEYGAFTPGRPIRGFVAGDLGIGHCVIVVPEVTRELQDFAVEVLGFRTYWPTRIGSTTVEFYRCNPRSHCLAYVQVPGMRGPHHFYIDTKHMDDVGQAYDRCRAQNAVVTDLGRLAQDDDVSFYLRTPTGVDIQYATGGRLFTDEDAWVNPSIMGNPVVWGHSPLLPGYGSAVRPVEKAKVAAE